MAIPSVEAIGTWGALADLAEVDREGAIYQASNELAELGDEDLRRQSLGMVAAECELPDDKLRVFTVSRIRVWLKLGPDVLKRISAPYEKATEKMSGSQAFRRVMMLQTLRNRFSVEDRRQLTDLAPSVFGGVEEQELGLFSNGAPKYQISSRPAKKKWWRFGKG